jgi:acyl dehydratase
MMATRLYQNTARIHFDLFAAKQGRFGRRLIYGGHVISLARALSFNGLANAFHVAAINGGRHVAPLFAGGTVYAWSEVLAKSELPGRDRCRRVAAAHRRGLRQAVYRFPAQDRRRLRSGGAARSRLLGADAAVIYGRARKCSTSCRA